MHRRPGSPTPAPERKAVTRNSIDMPFAPRLRPLLRIALVLLSTGVHAAAEEPQGLAGKTVTIHVGFGPGGGYDLYGRVLARHLGKHLPGQPAVVVSNMPGAASIRAANYLYNVAPRDGHRARDGGAVDRGGTTARHVRRELRRHQVRLDRTARGQCR